MLQRDLHAEEPDVDEVGPGPGRLAPERVHVEVPRFLEVAHRDGEMEDRLHGASLGPVDSGAAGRKEHAAGHRQGLVALAQ